MRNLHLVLAVCFLLFGGAGCLAPTDRQMTKQYPGSSFKGNWVYGAALNLAWNEAMEHFSVAPDQPASVSPESRSLITTLEKRAATSKDLDEGSYYVKSGYGPEILDVINRESRAKFPDKTFSDLQLQMEKDDFLAYAYLLKKVKYEEPFLKHDVRFRGQTVHGFNGAAGLSTSRVLKYWNDNRFILKMGLQDPNDELIVIKGYENSKPEEIVAAANTYNSPDAPRMGSNPSYEDKFEMPLLHLDYHHGIGLTLYFRKISEIGLVISLLLSKVELTISLISLEGINSSATNWFACISFVSTASYEIPSLVTREIIFTPVTKLSRYLIAPVVECLWSKK